MNMSLELNNGETVELNEAEQDQVYNHYRKACTTKALLNTISEQDLPIAFKSQADMNHVVDRIMNIMDDHHMSESEAIDTVLCDVEFVSNFIKDTID